MCSLQEAKRIAGFGLNPDSASLHPGYSIFTAKPRRAALDYMGSGVCPEISGVESFTQKLESEGKGLQIKRPDPRYRATILENKLYQQFGRRPGEQQ